MKHTSSLLIKNADYIVTMNQKKRIFQNTSLYIEGTRIIEVDTHIKQADTIINGSGKMVIPGLINCHHHMFQCTLRGLPQLQNQQIDKWIATVCTAVTKMNDEIMYYSALANMAELLLYGCTTTTDMLYIFPNGKNGFFEATIRAANDIGIRFHPYRGSMSLSEKNGALFPDDVVEDSDTIASKTESLFRKFNDASDDSMVRIGIAPCTIFTSTAQDFKNAVLLSKKYNLNMQTHLAESEFENTYALQKFKKRPLSYLRYLGWEGKHVSFTHCINVTPAEIQSIVHTKSNVVHCPISNARSPIGDSGVAPIWKMLKKGVNVSIGVDGSAGNDTSNVLEEIHSARVIQGIPKNSTYLPVQSLVDMATTNGARMLCREDYLGSIEVGKIADLALFDLHQIEYAGYNDPLTAIISCQTKRAHTVIVNGRVVVDDFHLKTIDEQMITRRMNKIHLKLHT